MITKEKMLWSFIKWKWAEIGMENYCVRGVFLNVSCWQISWSRKSFTIILKLQLKERPVTYWISWENSRDFTTPPLVSFPAKWRLRKDCNNSILMTCHYPDLGSASDWLRQISRHNQSEALPRSGMLAYVISRKNQWNQCSRNVGCFLRLSIE